MHDDTRRILRGEYVLDLVRRERDRQDRLRDEGVFLHTCAGDGMTHAERLAVLGEEYGEAIDEYVALRLASLIGRVAREVLTQPAAPLARDTAGSPDSLLRELVQLAAVACAWCEYLVEREERHGA